ncbi:hypothetical protein fugu_010806 [Takifugu bimaculatus]|uniref:Dehydrogenase/reductase 13 n=1 Tax=Takifugu bimaculatus TaxID=433685 RepID=A0A4Z2CB96_9TELE|nr:hypothetical protein fugu_010806 [Takifugu bimaculatus]
MSALLYLVAGAVLTYVAVYYGWFRAARCTWSGTLSGKTAVVTGSSSGIGKATALALAKRGARVILACRSQERAEAAAFDIRRESGNAQVVVMRLDLGSLTSVRRFAASFLKTEPRLDLLVNSAGVMGPGRTEDGFGMAFGVNHLGHFLLANLLLERLRRCGPSRVVTVATVLPRLGRVDFPLLASRKDLVSGDSAWSVFQAYCSSQLCNVLFTRELANRLEGAAVSCYSLHPGAVHTCRGLGAWLQLLALPFAKLFFTDAEGGAQAVLHCALQEGIEPLSGRHFSRCTPQQVGARGRDDAVAKKLWELSDSLFPGTLRCSDMLEVTGVAGGGAAASVGGPQNGHAGAPARLHTREERRFGKGGGKFPPGKTRSSLNSSPSPSGVGTFRVNGSR